MARTCPNRRNGIGGTPPNPADGNDCIASASNFLFHSSRYYPGIKGETATATGFASIQDREYDYSELSVFQSFYALHYELTITTKPWHL